jgi:GH24 family phage-related lysozyme (muramidase)
MTKTPVQFLDLFRYYKGLPHQIAAIQQLGELIPASLLHRENEWFHTWSQAGKQPDPDWLAPALAIIKEWEGLRLEAYKCPAGVWTIGYGTTRYPGPSGGPVRKDDAITVQQADYLLQTALFDLFAPGVFHLIPNSKKWSGNQIAALISFAYNVGLAALEDSTLRKRLNANEDRVKVVSEELPKWVHADGKVLEGLVRRRNAEVALFVGKPLQQEVPQQPAKLSPESPFSARLTPNIRLGEFALDQEARRFDHSYQINTAAELAEFLERVRRNFGNKPVVLTSGYRPPAINASVGGASGSEHLYNAPGVGAVDFYVKGADIKAVQSFCDKYWPYSVGYGAPKGFVHLGIRAGRPKLRWDY